MGESALWLSGSRWGANGGGTFGEATPIYMYWPDSIRRLHRYDPDAKIIVLLRHPIFRAHSHWRMETKRRSETLPFSEAIRDGRARVKQAPGGAHRVYSYVERGFYAGQIEQILGYFPHTQVHIATTDQLWAKPKFTLNAIERFLGVGQELDPRREYIVSASTEVPDLIKQSDFKYLMELFRSDIRHTASLTGIPLQDWLDENYTELDRSTY